MTNADYYDEERRRLLELLSSLGPPSQAPAIQPPEGLKLRDKLAILASSIAQTGQIGAGLGQGAGVVSAQERAQREAYQAAMRQQELQQIAAQDQERRRLQGLLADLDKEQRDYQHDFELEGVKGEKERELRLLDADIDAARRAGDREQEERLMRQRHELALELEGRRQGGRMNLEKFRQGELDKRNRDRLDLMERLNKAGSGRDPLMGIAEDLTSSQLRGFFARDLDPVDTYLKTLERLRTGQVAGPSGTSALEGAILAMPATEQPKVRQVVNELKKQGMTEEQILQALSQGE